MYLAYVPYKRIKNAALTLIRQGIEKLITEIVEPFEIRLRDSVLDHFIEVSESEAHLNKKNNNFGWYYSLCRIYTLTPFRLSFVAMKGLTHFTPYLKT